MSSKLEELIEKLCPNGVGYKRIDDICDKVFAGGTPRTSNDNYYHGNIPWLRSGEVNFNVIVDSEIKITEEGLKKSSAKWIKEKSVLLAMTGATVARSAVNEIPITANQSICAMEVSERINYKYLFYNIVNMYNEIRGMSQGALTSINLNIIKSIRIPVPPLEVQCEIVRILDNFTELTAELTAELKARRKQYKFCRDEVLSDNTQKKVYIKDITLSVKSGKNKIRNSCGLYPVYGSTGIITKTNEFIYDKEQILIARVGANAGYVQIAKDKYDVSDNTLIIELKDNILMKYIYYYLQKYNLNKIARGGGQPLITAGQIKEIEVYLPSYDRQIEIVNVLDKLDKLCNDISQGLPAEIEARQKQYEYYRDKLLTFKELKGV